MKSILINKEDLQFAMDEYNGYCVYCGEEQYEVEPDARGYECESCGKKGVYGMEELMLMGLVEVIDSE